MQIAKRKTTSPNTQSIEGAPTPHAYIVLPLGLSAGGEAKTTSRKRADREDNCAHLDFEETRRVMSLRASLLRIGLIVLLYGTLWAGNRWGSPQDVFIENHPAGLLLRHLNWLFKSFGWLITGGSWAMLLGARAYRQSSLQENVNWRRHNSLDAVLWVMATVYWYACTSIFHLVANSMGECHLSESSILDESVGAASRSACLASNGHWIPFDISGHTFLASLGICLLLEELIRFIGEPTYYFTRHHQTDPMMRSKARRAQSVWWATIAVSLIVVGAWGTLYVRTAFYYHEIVEKILGTVVGTFYWLLVVATRYIMLYHISVPRTAIGSFPP